MTRCVLGYFRHFAAAEYWRARAIRAEERLEAEALRNRTREDIFVSAAVMGSRGMMGVAPRSAPAQMREPPKVFTAANPWDGLTWHEKAEFETEWLLPAIQRGIPRQKAEQDFMNELLKRKANPDEPMIG